MINSGTWKDHEPPKKWKKTCPGAFKVYQQSYFAGYFGVQYLGYVWIRDLVWVRYI